MLTTADAPGWSDFFYKGGLPGFVRVLDEQTLAFPSYDGNGMFRSLGDLLINPQVGLLFIDFEQARRLRGQGRASLRHIPPVPAWKRFEMFRDVLPQRDSAQGPGER